MLVPPPVETKPASDFDSFLPVLEKHIELRYRPLGVIGVIGPWNFPLHTPMGSISYALNDKLTLGTSIGLTRSVNDRAASDNNIYSPFANAIASAPITASMSR